MKKLSKSIDVSIEKTNTGFSAFAEDLGIYSTAKSVDSLTSNLVEALNLYYEDEEIFVDHANLRLHLDIPQFFRYYKVLNAKFLAGRIGMNPVLLSQYVRGKKKPSQKQTLRIMNGIQSIGKELSALDLRLL